jgi:hypothetical protein
MKKRLKPSIAEIPRALYGLSVRRVVDRKVSFPNREFSFGSRSAASDPIRDLRQNNPHGQPVKSCLTTGGSIAAQIDAEDI